jgi:hypothetical protein
MSGETRTGGTCDEKREGGKSTPLVKWGFGQGQEGVFVQPTETSGKVLITGRGIPWWGMVIARLELRIHSILLSDSRFSSLVGSYFGSSIPVGKVHSQTHSDIMMTRNALNACAVVALEILPNPQDVLSEMWVMSRVRIILVAHGKLIPPLLGGNKPAPNAPCVSWRGN